MSQRQDKTDHGLYEYSAVTNALVLALILLFAALSIALIVLGAQAYEAVDASAQRNAQRRATVNYVLSRLRAFDEADAVQIETAMLDGALVCVLTLEESIEGDVYATRIYCAEGKLREQTVPCDIPLEGVQDGETIGTLAGFDAQREGGLLTLHFMHEDGEHSVVHAALQSSGGETP